MGLKSKQKSRKTQQCTPLFIYRSGCSPLRMHGQHVVTFVFLYESSHKENCHTICYRRQPLRMDESVFMAVMQIGTSCGVLSAGNREAFNSRHSLMGPAGGVNNSPAKHNGVKYVAHHSAHLERLRSLESFRRC